MTTQLISVVSGQINGQSALTVDARELHTFMGIAAHFKDWITRRIADYGFVENQDFEVSLKFEQNPQGGRPSKEYRLTLGMAKELAMVERTEKGRMVRRYFIDCERLTRVQQTDLDRLRSQLAACHAELLKAKPLWGKITRYKRLGLNHVEVGLLVSRSRDRVRRNVRRVEACGLLAAPDPAQLSLLED